ncbi:MAG: oligosaccharide flippase family protein [Melioribacteraceae bacterium]|nr:oligosaccharide flippase family protein [Saprospiraceae bacterium]MCF8355741.1 oligosaccharide flippase family protein [Melioribacteraceae bacterium]MCF8394769.1 oligosaccharide flippase family protein [Melioribacteraceae bacterium]
MRINKFAKHSIFYSIGNILPQAVGFILLPIYTAFLEPSQYGIVNSMTVLSAVVGVLLTLGIDRGIYRLYYDYDENERRVYLGTILIGLAFFSLTISCLVLVFPSLLSCIFQSIPFYPYYFLMLSFTLLSRIIIIPSIYLRISEQAGKYVLLSLTSFILTASFNLLFVIYYKEGAVGMLKGTLFANAIMTPIFYIFTYNSFILKFKLKYFVESLKFSLPILPSFIFAWILNLSDRIFLEHYLTLNEVGIYSLGYKIASIITVIAGGIFQAYTPFFYKLANEKHFNFKTKIEKYNDFLVIIILIICFFISFFSKEFMKLFISFKYYESINLIPILSVAFFFSQTTALLNLMIYQEKKSLQNMYLTFFASLINVISNIILIPFYGMMGSAIATIISFSVLFISKYWYARKCYFIPFKWQIIIPTIIVLVTIYGFFELLQINSVLLSLSLKIAVALTISFFVYLKYSSQISTVFIKK